ncbi:MAG: Crp/Fnr family transcriptional regulator [Herpetosiphonaceae bacterium]|nr:Crp/Fnr family transcriptional regulator [Herpetosiphonaceae bacterium]
MLTESEHNLLHEVDLFDGLMPEQSAAISMLLQRKTFPAGTNLMLIEQPGEVVYIILSGTVKIHVEQADGTDVIIAILGAGDTVGEMSLLDSVGRSANVITQEESTLLWLDRSAFQQCLRTAPVITYNLVRTLSSRLRLANEQIQALATLDVYGRVARQLLAFAQKYGKADAAGNIVIPIRLTQSDIAGLVGASRERVNGAIVHFKNRGYISIDQNFRITVHNLEALAKRCR